jgi:hypothetical protein
MLCDQPRVSVSLCRKCNFAAANVMIASLVGFRLFSAQKIGAFLRKSPKRLRMQRGFLE